MDSTLLDLQILAKAASKHSEKLKALLTGLLKHIMVKMNVKMQLLQKFIVFLDTKLSKILYNIKLLQNQFFFKYTIYIISQLL